VRTSEIKLQLNNATGAWSAKMKQSTVGSFVLFLFYFTMCDGLNSRQRTTVLNADVPNCYIPRYLSALIFYRLN